MALDGTVHVQDAATPDRTVCGLSLKDVPWAYMQATNYAKYWYRQQNPKFCATCKEEADRR